MNVPERTLDEQLDSICERFEHDWKLGARNNMKPYLREVTRDQRKRLLRMLVAIDLELKRKSGEAVSIADYKYLGERAVGHVRTVFEDAQSTVASDEPEIEELKSINKPPKTTKKRPSRQIGPYRLVKLIGKGGMGAVWLAEQKSPVSRIVALKLLAKPQVDGKRLKNRSIRLEAERQALAMMDHPCIAKVLDAGTTPEGQSFFVMEYLPGISLTKYCDRNAVNIRDRLEIFSAVCRGVQHAHHKGIIHRDLKPDNILVVEVDGEPVPKVIDFGLAKVFEGEAKLTKRTIHTVAGAPMGTWQYMSPEQTGQDETSMDTRTDIYSLGAILYELLVGSTPIEKTTLDELDWVERIKLIREVDPPRPSNRLKPGTDRLLRVAERRSIDAVKLKSELHGELDWIVMRAIDKDPSRRYASAIGLAKDVRRYLDGEVIEARPPSSQYMLKKFVDRHKALVGVAATLIGTLVLAISFTTWFAIDANLARKKAEQKTEELKKATDEWQDQARRANEEAAKATAAEKLAQKAKNQAVMEKEKVIELDKQLKKEKLQLKKDQKMVQELGQKLRVEKAQTDKFIAESKYQKAIRRVDAKRYLLAEDLLEDMPLQHRDFAWYLDRGRMMGSDMTCFGHSGIVHDVAVFKSGENFVTCSGIHFNHGAVIWWDIKTGEPLKSQLYKGEVRSIACSPRNNYVAIATNQNTIILNPELKKVVELTGHTKKVTKVKFSQDGRFLASASEDKTVRIWDAIGGRLRFGGPVAKHKEKVTDFEFHPNGEFFYSTSYAGEIKVFNLKSAKQVKGMKSLGPVDCLAISPDGERLAYCSRNDTKVHEFSKSYTDLARKGITLQGHANSIRDVAFSPDGSQIATASKDYSIKLWDAYTHELVHTFHGHSDEVNSIEFSLDGTRILSASADHLVKVWGLTALPAYRSAGTNWRSLSTLKVSHDGEDVLLTGSTSGANCYAIWNTAKRDFSVPFKKLDAYPHKCCFNHDDSRIAVAAKREKVFLVDREGAVEKILPVGNLAISDVHFLPTGKLLVGVDGSNQGVECWSLESNAGPVFRCPTTDSVFSIASTPDGSLFAVGCKDGYTYLIDSNSGKIARKLKKHKSWVTTVAFSSDGKKLATGGYYDDVKIWEVATGKLLDSVAIVSRGNTSVVERVMFCNDDQQLIAGYPHDRVGIWDIKSGEEKRVLSSKNSRFAMDRQENVLITLDEQFNPIQWEIANAREFETINVYNSDPVDRYKSRLCTPLFSPDGNSIYIHAIKYYAIFDLRQNQVSVVKKTPEWENNYSPDGSRFAVTLRNKLLLVNTNFKKGAYEKAKREQLSAPKPEWHKQRLSKFKRPSQSYSALFHLVHLYELGSEKERTAEEIRKLVDKIDRYGNRGGTWRRQLPYSLRKILSTVETAETDNGSRSPDF